VKKRKNCPWANVAAMTVITIPFSAKVTDAFCVVIMRTNDVRYNCRSRFVEVENAIWGKIVRLERSLQDFEEFVDIFIFETRTKRQHILLALEMQSNQILPIITDDPKGCFISFQSTPTPFFSVHYMSATKTFPPSAVCTSLVHPLMNLLANLEVSACFVHDLLRKGL
jgi:hypothetical protein